MISKSLLVVFNSFIRKNRSCNVNLVLIPEKAQIVSYSRMKITSQDYYANQILTISYQKLKINHLKDQKACRRDIIMRLGGFCLSFC